MVAIDEDAISCMLMGFWKRWQNETREAVKDSLWFRLYDRRCGTSSSSGNVQRNLVLDGVDVFSSKFCERIIRK